MPMVRLGSSGVKVSRICLGTMGFGSPQWRPWVKGEAESLPILKRALDLGINFLDTADMYSVGKSEEVVGKAIEGRREDVVLATKVFNPMGPGPNEMGLSRKHVQHGIKASLARLGTDYTDLYQIHRYDAETPMDEILGTLSGLVDDGCVRYLGASTMWAWQLALCLGRQEERGWHPFVTMQNHWNLVYREEEREMVPLCRHKGVGLIPWSPLARGFLAGRESREHGSRKATDGGRVFYRDERSLEIAHRVEKLAEEKGVKAAQIGIAWLLHQPGVTAPIVGATKVQHVEDAVAALDVKLNDGELAFLEEPYQPRGVAGWIRGGGVPRQHLDEEEP